MTSREASLLSVPAEQRGAIVDSGASSHFCPDCSKFTTFTPITPKPINIADRCTIYATGRGDVVIELPKGTERSRVTLKDALFTLDIAFTLTVINCHLKHIFCNSRHYTTPQIMMDRFVPT